MDKYLIIIWSNARQYQDEILADMQTRFNRVKQYEIAWSHLYVESNFSRFFEKPMNMREIEKKYGVGNFLFCVVETNQESIIAAKGVYQKIVKFSDSIYISTTPKRVNRDVTLLLGKNSDDLQQDENYQNPKLEKISKDLEGAECFNNLAHLFYVLNNTINYVVLRNYEKLPNDYDLSIHGDIDLLVEDLHQVISVTNAIKYFPEKPTSVAYWVKLKDEDMQFDFRYLGDGYLDKRWEKDVLRSARPNIPPPHSDVFMIMSPMHQYFTLLYHAYVQKIKIALDYPGKLEGFAMKIGATYKNDVKFSMSQLWDFMKEYGYHISIPSEKEGTLNWSHLKYTDEYISLRIKYFFRRRLWLYFEKIHRKANKIIKKTLHI